MDSTAHKTFATNLEALEQIVAYSKNPTVFKSEDAIKLRTDACLREIVFDFISLGGALTRLLSSQVPLRLTMPIPPSLLEKMEGALSFHHIFDKILPTTIYTDLR